MAIQTVPEAHVRVVSKSSMLHRHWLGGGIHVAESGADSRYGFACTFASMRAGGGPSWHVHTREEEFFYVRRGQWEFEAFGQDRVRVGPGQLITLPVGVPHRFEVLSTDAEDSTGACVLWTCPGGNAQFFIELSNPLDEPEDKTMPPDLAAMTKVGHRFGIWMLQPDDDPADFVSPLGVDRHAVVRGHDEPTFDWNGIRLRWLVDAGDTNGRCEIAVMNIPADTAFPRLQHGRYEVGAVVLNGEVIVEDEAGRHVATTESMIHVPFGSRYRFATREQPAELLWLSTPCGLRSFFETDNARGYGVVVDKPGGGCDG